MRYFIIRTDDTVEAGDVDEADDNAQMRLALLAINQFRPRGPNGSGRISLSQDPAMSLQYAGELIAAFIEQTGGSVKGKISTGTRTRGTGAGLRSPTVAYSFGDPRRVAPRLEQLHRQPGLPGDRRTPPGRAS